MSCDILVVFIVTDTLSGARLEEWSVLHQANACIVEQRYLQVGLTAGILCLGSRVGRFHVDSQMAKMIRWVQSCKRRGCRIQGLSQVSICGLLRFRS